MLSKPAPVKDEMMKSVVRMKAALAAAFAVWGLLLVVGFSVMHRYEISPGPKGLTVRRWPAEARIRPDLGRINLVMFAHPRCPCTRSSVEELARIMSRAGGDVSARVVFFQPERPTSPWTSTALWRSAEAIPGVRVVADAGGEEARRFGAVTSGDVFVFDRAGAVLYEGGVTPVRGEAGVNAGSNAVSALLNDGATDRAEFPVFGCLISSDRRTLTRR